MAIASEFPMGDASKKWGVRVENNDAQFDLRLGTRLQAIGALKQETDQNDDQTHNTDFYVRRMRLMVEVNYLENWKFYADIRNDDVNKKDGGESDFNLGDAFLETKVQGGKVRLLRAKVDVSRTETVSSARLLFLNRASIADQAAQYVSHNRRATNAQYLGKIGDKFSYQIVAGDGATSSKFVDANGNTPDSINRQNMMVGSRVRFSPLSNYKPKKLTEVYYGTGKTFDIGFGVFNTSNIEITHKRADGTSRNRAASRTLYNAELSYAEGPFTVLLESFRFDGQFEDLTSSSRLGSSSGHMIQTEYVFNNFYAPYFRYETWDHFDQESDYTQNAYVIGLNRYLKGEKMRYGLFYTHDTFEKNIGDKTTESVQLTLMMNY